MTDREGTQRFELMNILINHTGETLMPDIITKITEEMKTAMTTGPCSWAFKETNPSKS